MATVCAEEQFTSPSVILRGTPGPPVELPSEVVHPDSAHYLNHLRTQLHTTVFRLLLSAHTASEFNELRRELFPKYQDIAATIASIIKTDTGEESRRRMLDDAFDNLESLFASDKVLFSEHDGSREEAAFGLDALKRAHVLLCQISDAPAPTEVAEHDTALIVRCLGALWWSHLHLHCLLYAIRHTLLPTQEVKDALLAGLRVSLMAYAAVRQSWGIRFDVAPQHTPVESGTVERNEEECSLLTEAEADYNFIVARDSHGSTETR